MSEIIFNVDTFDKAKFLEESKNGLSEKSYKNKMESTINATYLPKSGKFVSLKFAEVVNTISTKEEDSKNLNHWRVVTDKGDSISLSSLQALTHKGSADSVVLKQVTRENSALKGKFVVSSQAVNPQLVGKQVDIAARLIGKEFEAEEIEGYILPFKAEGYSTEDEARKALTTKTFYKVTLK